MTRSEANPGAHWCRSSPVGLDRSGLDGGRSIPFPGELHPPANFLEPVCRLAVKSSVRSSRSSFLLYWAWLHLPNLGRVLCNGAVTRKLPRAGDIQDCFVSPPARVGVQCADLFLRLAVRS